MTIMRTINTPKIHRTTVIRRTSMSNTPADQPSGRRGSGSTPKLLWLWIGIAAVVVLAAVVAIVSSGDDEELTVGSTVPASADQDQNASGDPVSTDGDGGSGGSTAAAAQVAEVWPVTIGGTPLVGLPDSGTDPAVGTQAPTLSGFAFDGTPVTVDPSKGPVMLVFLAHWCPHCNREIPELLKWRDSGAVPDGLQVIAVTTAVAPDRDNYPPSEWIPNMGWTWPVVADSQDNEAAIAFGVSGFPFSVIIGTDGSVLARSSGELGEAGISAYVDAALG
jgi:cytochrome c biogenesis protein CcmG, thiol:disulfide interchange protein DsbE